MTMAAAAGGGILSSLLGAFGSQSRTAPAAPAARIDTSTVAIGSIGDRRARRDALRNAREERRLALLTDPQLMGVAITIGGLMLSTHLPFSADPLVNRNLQAISAASAVLMGLGRAGVGDLTTMGMAAMAGAGTAIGSEGILELPSGLGGLTGYLDLINPATAPIKLFSALVGLAG